MAEYINKEETIKALGEEPLAWTDSDAEIAERNRYQYDRAAIETVQSIQIVKCDECKYHEEAEGGYEYCHKWLRETYRDWFCSRGNINDVLD